MSVYEALTEEECYLYAVLTDESGIDHAEFAYTDEESDDGIFRAWHFQWPWWRCGDELQIDRGSRSSGKSMSMKFRTIAFPFCVPGGQMLLTAPEGIHLDAITDVIETGYMGNRLFEEMLAPGRNGIKHRPFKINFANGAVVHGRIPKHDGSGVKGVHPDWLEQDEASDYPEAGWAELYETLKQKEKNSGTADSRWRAHGVTRGVGGTFDEKTRPDSDWTVHALPAMYRPTWDDDERASKITQYGSVENVDFRRNIYGLPGDASSPIFVLNRLMLCVDTEEFSDYNADQYYDITIDEGELADSEWGIEGLMDDIPSSHTAGDGSRFWIGMDVGWTQAPSVIVVFVEEKKRKGDGTALRLLAKITLRRIDTENQVAAIMHLFKHYRPVAFALDSTGAGMPLLDVARGWAKRDPESSQFMDRVIGYNFSAKIAAGFDENVEIDAADPDGWEKAVITRNVLEWSTDVLRKLVDEKALLLPYDRNLIGEMQGQTWKYSRSALDAYGRKRLYSAGQFHALDAMRMAALAYKQEWIDTLIQNHKNARGWEPPDAIFL